MAEEFSLMDWLQKAKADPKVAAQPLVIILAVAFMGWKFLYSPQKVIYTKELKKNQAVIGQIKGLESAVANAEEIKLNVHELRQAKEEAEKICYRKGEGPVFMQRIKEIGRKTGLDIKNISPLPATEKTFEVLKYELFPIKIGFVGDFAKLGIFLRTLETQDKLVFVDLPPLAADASGSFKIDLNPTAVMIVGEISPANPPPGSE